MTNDHGDGSRLKPSKATPYGRITNMVDRSKIQQWLLAWRSPTSETFRSNTTILYNCIMITADRDAPPIDLKRLARLASTRFL